MSDDHPDDGPESPERWVYEAIAQQEEYLKRIRPCQDVPFQEHWWENRSPRPGVVIQACGICKVTRTDEDYQRKTAGLPD